MSSTECEPVPTLVASALKVHNLYRKKHGAEPLKLDHRLCLQAQGFAQALADYKSEGELPSGVGRNVYRVTRASLEDPTKVVDTAVAQWYGQRSDYNFDDPLESKGKTEYFTQILWASTKLFGVGVAMSVDKKFISVVALYSPSGNEPTLESYRDNVRPALY